MMEIRECGTGWPASFTVKLNGGHWYEVSHQNELRAIFLSKEDAQRFIRNETIRRESQEGDLVSLAVSGVIADFLDRRGEDDIAKAIREAVAEEREACLDICGHPEVYGAKECYDMIKRRGE
jgi:hypothetical protein